MGLLHPVHVLGIAAEDAGFIGLSRQLDGCGPTFETDAAFVQFPLNRAEVLGDQVSSGTVFRWIGLVWKDAETTHRPVSGHGC